MPPDQSTDALSIIGFFLTLAGLLGSFFYIHLSDWYRDVSVLEVKWKINRFGDEPDKKAARRECRYEVEKISSWTILLTTGVVTSFILFVAILSTILWQSEPDKNQAWLFIGLAGLAFLAVYLATTAYFIYAGYKKATNLKQQIQISFAANQKK